MSDHQNETWPEKLHLSDMHASEIVNWMQDFAAPEAGHADSRGHYIREDLHIASIAERDAEIAKRDEWRAEYKVLRRLYELFADKNRSLVAECDALRAEVERLRAKLEVEREMKQQGEHMRAAMLRTAFGGDT